MAYHFTIHGVCSIPECITHLYNSRDGCKSADSTYAITLYIVVKFDRQLCSCSVFVCSPETKTSNNFRAIGNLFTPLPRHRVCHNETDLFQGGILAVVLWSMSVLVQHSCSCVAHCLQPMPGHYSLRGRTSCRKISWSLEAAKFVFWLFLSLWNLNRHIGRVPGYVECVTMRRSDSREFFWHVLVINDIWQVCSVSLFVSWETWMAFYWTRWSYRWLKQTQFNRLMKNHLWYS